MMQLKDLQNDAFMPQTSLLVLGSEVMLRQSLGHPLDGCFKSQSTSVVVLT